MKKIVIALFVLLLSACALGKANTPKEKVKEFLDKYKNQDSEVLKDLDEIVSNEYSGDYAERYKTLMINQYKNLEYNITDEIIEGDQASVVTEITVLNYSSAVDSANAYLSEHQNEFMSSSSSASESRDSNASDETSTDENSTFDNDRFLDYKLGLLENVSDKRNYTIEFTFRKENDKWVMDSLSETDIEKLHGLYSE